MSAVRMGIIARKVTHNTMEMMLSFLARCENLAALSGSAVSSACRTRNTQSARNANYNVGCFKCGSLSRLCRGRSHRRLHEVVLSPYYSQVQYYRGRVSIAVYSILRIFVCCKNCSLAPSSRLEIEWILVFRQMWICMELFFSLYQLKKHQLLISCSDFGILSLTSSSDRFLFLFKLHFLHSKMSLPARISCTGVAPFLFSVETSALSSLL